jgi:hypothetical protein
MPVTIPEGRRPNSRAVWRRIGWFVALYLFGVGAVGAIAFLLKIWIKA